MADIPKDILAKATALLDAASAHQYPDGTLSEDAYEVVARAILAERQRCADIAKGWVEDEFQPSETKLAAAYIWREVIRGEPT